MCFRANPKPAMPIRRLKQVVEFTFGSMYLFENGTEKGWSFFVEHTLEIPECKNGDWIDFTYILAKNRSGKENRYLTSMKVVEEPMPLQMTITPKYINPPKDNKPASINDGNTYFNFDVNKIPIASFSKGRAVTVEVEQQGEYKGVPTYKIVGLVQSSVAGSGGAGSGGAAASTATPASDGWPKERVQGHRRLEIAKACIQANVGQAGGDIWLAWVNQADNP